MPGRLIELAIEALESKKAAIDAEIAQLRKELRPTRTRRHVRVRRTLKRPHISAAGRKALSERMKARWAEWRAERAKKTRAPSRKTTTKKTGSRKVGTREGQAVS